MKASYLDKYRDIFQAVRNKVYAKTVFPGVSPNEYTTINSTLSPGDVDTMSHSLIFDPNDDMLYSMGDGVEAYVSQVNELLDGGGFHMDEALDAWYDALMGEIQNS